MNRTLFSALAALLLVIPVLAHSASQQADAEATPIGYDAVLTPRLGSDGEVSGIAVVLTLDGGLTDGETRLKLTAPVVYVGAYGVADRMGELAVRDADGPVALSHHDDSEAAGGFPYLRHWEAQREVQFPVQVRYTAATEPHTDRRGPPFNIKPSKGGVSGSGATFLVLPENTVSTRSRVGWNLSAFGEDAAGIASFGEGEFELDGAPGDLWHGWYMAGPVGRYPAQGDDNGFSAAWLGDFPFDPTEEMTRAARGYTWLGGFFGYLDPPPRYRVFMRIVPYPIPRFSGTALGGSFMLSGPPNGLEDTGGEPPRGTIFHEMIHMWVGGVQGPQGVTSWFSEGLTSYYTMVLPLRGGFETLDDYTETVDRLPERYYTSPALGMSAQAITEVGFTNNDIREMPYVRGNLYFADLNARIRAASNGRRNLDDFMRELFERRHNETGYTFDHEAWVAAISTELGAEAGTEFQARIIDGEVFFPVAGTFGPCFDREPASYETESGAVDGYRWQRNDVPEERCAEF